MTPATLDPTLIVIIILMGVMFWGMITGTWVWIPIVIVGAFVAIWVSGLVKKKKPSKIRRHMSAEYRDKIFNQHNNICDNCPQKEGLQIHHKDNNPSHNSESNLSVLCYVCHKKRHMKVR